MSKKKSYMNKSNLINEGFFDNLLKIFKIFPNLNKSNKVKKKIKKDIKDLNYDISNLEKMMNDEMKRLGSDKKLKLTKFKLKDFIKGI
tara:strand:+ start:645 stop:908 length:264 start_codon:yes stop_codon:yes gene_type:complete